ncbi:hypothetical protein BOTNAR_0654g00030 [Botryotinia narcissicola]|uniref:Acetyl-coenzyme A transporter 1 n=1 Tax=Botryotinia narcissicola TaxID=278944 RepID=A0A4Z1H9Q6_9HELO|nr:hypothetical protein BOTNAR_0654g00030 [Botryotinia narcissicola]
MPTPLGDTIPSLTSQPTSDNPRHTHLPSHHDPEFPYAQELDDLSTATSRHRIISSSKSKSKPNLNLNLHGATQAEDSKHLLGDQDSTDEDEEEVIETDSMGTRSRKGKVPEPLGSSSATRGEDSQSQKGSMNGNVEYRRKNANLDSPGVTANLMSRESFTLDDPIPKTPTLNNHGFSELPMQDKRNFLLLVLLYFLQGVPMGLATGSVPFLLKPHMTYSALGVFSLASYPYSLKLLWSPIVDAIWSPRVGRRKSWIMPIQMLSGLGMIWLGSQIKEMMITAGANDGAGIWGFTGWWFFLIFTCATQDIAVDGWALTLLSPGNISYASTAQTVGLTAGQFMSFTVFLAFNAPDFANKWFRKTPLDEGVMTLGGYLTFWGWTYIIVTLGLALLKREEKTKNEDGIWDVYKVMWGVLKLKNIQTIIIIHLIAKISFQANDGVTNLKLIDKGFSQEDMALTVLIDFPFEIGLGYYAGKWSTSYTPIRLWCWGFVGRLIAAVIAQITDIIFPANGVDTWYLLVVIAEHIFSTFTNTVMFVAISAFHARIADPVIGGTYMTLLATVSNLGGTFPRFFVLKLVDYFTTATCIPPGSDYKLAADLKGPLITSTFSCALAAEKDRCLSGGGICDIERDGYYVVNIICIIFGAVTFWGYIKPAALKLQALTLRAWRISEGSN